MTAATKWWAKHPRLKEHLQEIFFKRKKHWLRVLGLIVVGIWISHSFETNNHLRDVRYGVSQFIQDLSPKEARFQDTVVVLVDDPTYYRGEPAHRRPFKRDYLGKLVKKIAEFKPSLIAIDFDLRSRSPVGNPLVKSKDGAISLPVDEAYIEETAEFVRSIDETAAQCKIVLPDTVNSFEQGLRREENIYDEFKFREGVTKGYIQLDDKDRRIIPKIQTLNDGTHLDSFCLAIVRAYRPNVINDHQWHEKFLARFVSPNKDDDVSTTELFDPQSLDKVKTALANKIVIVGGGWHDRGESRGKLVDMHATPVGDLQGALVHANYVESILRQNYLRPTHNAWLIEVAFALFLAYILLVPIRPMWAKSLAVLGVLAMPWFLNYFFVQNLGMNFDVFVISLLLCGHVGAEQIFEMYHDSKKYHKIKDEYQKLKNAQS